MAHNPHAPQGPESGQDPAGSTQMFRAFVDEAAPQRQPAPPARSGARTGVLAAVIIAVVVVAAAAWLAFS